MRDTPTTSNMSLPATPMLPLVLEYTGIWALLLP
jgi:hypothetical protein